MKPGLSESAHNRTMPNIVEDAMVMEPMGKFAQNGRVDGTGKQIENYVVRVKLGVLLKVWCVSTLLRE